MSAGVAGLRAHLFLVAALLQLLNAAGAPWLCNEPRYARFRARVGSREEILDLVTRGLPASGNASTASSPATASISLPPIEPGSPVNLSLGLAVKRIWAVSQKEQTYKIKYEVITHWVDCRLSWSSSGPQRLVVQEDSKYWGYLWRPTMHLLQEESREISMMSEAIILKHSGVVYHIQMLVSTMHCPLTFENLPYDRHDCSLTFHARGYPPNEVNVRWSNISSLPALSIMELSDPEWYFSDPREWRSEEIPDSNLFNVQGKVLQTHFVISRRAYHMVKSNILPCVIYWFISYLAMWVDAAAVPGRAALHALPILMLANKLNAVQAGLPSIAYATKLSYFLFFNIFIASVQLLEFCVVNTACRVAKHLGGLQKTAAADSEDAEGGEQATPKRRNISLCVAVWVRDRLDMHSRWFFLLVYIVCITPYLTP